MSGRAQCFLLVLALLCRGDDAAADSCADLTDLMTRLNPGFWAPAFVFRSLQVRPGSIHPPNMTHLTQKVQLTGMCSANQLRADLFTWQKPTSDGGDWIAATSPTGIVELLVEGYRCPLTGIAITTSGWPSLRLQFEECPRKTAVEVPLVKQRPPRQGVKLVHWMCKVSVGSRLCNEAALQVAQNGTSKTWGDQTYLDLSMMAGLMSLGLTRMQVYNECFENLDWYVASTPLGVDMDEFPMLEAITKILAPRSLPTQVQIPARIVVDTVCAEDCSGRTDPKCHTVPPPPPRLPHAKDFTNTLLAFDWSGGFETFIEGAGNRNVLPWLVYLFGACFVIGGGMSWCCVVSSWKPVEAEERKVKSVSIVYSEVPEEQQTFFSGMGGSLGRPLVQGRR